MSKQVKIVIGVVAIVVLFACFLVGLTGFAVSRSWNFRAMVRPPQSAAQLEVRLLDDDEDGIPDRAVAALPGPVAFDRNPAFNRSGRFNQGFSGQGSQLDVRLIDDDGDGVPDRGVLDIPAGPGFEPRFDSSRTFGRRFEPSWDQDRFTSRRFTPFVILGGLFRLAILATVLAGLVVLGVVLFRHWRNPLPSPAAPEAATPPEAEVGVTEPPPTDQDASSASSTEVESELDTAEGEGIEPEEDQPDK